MPDGALVAKRDAPVGGQAVLEGVMMRGISVWAVAVRRPDGEIEISSEPIKPWAQRHRLWRLPVLRGVVALGESLKIGFRALAISANAQLEDDEDGEPEEIGGWVWGLTIAFSMALAVGLFFVIPVGLTSLIKDQLGSPLLFWLVEGVLRTAIFIGYIVAISRLQDLRRVFEYHGAEHKTISCYEAEDELTPARAKLYSRLHPRCGTSFLLIVMVLAIFVFAPIGLPAWYWLLASRILGIPLIAGLSYEVIKWAGKNRRKRWVRAMMWPGLMLQNLTTREPDEEQLAVAIASLESGARRGVARAGGRRAADRDRRLGASSLVYVVSRDRFAGRTDRGALRRARGQMSDPAVIGDRERYAEVGREYRELQPAQALAVRYRTLKDDLEGARELLAEGEDEELRKVVDEAPQQIEALEEEIRLAMVERDPNDAKNVLVEIRAGTGGDEAALFAGDLYKMLTRYAEERGFATEALSQSSAEVGGFKEVTFAIKGEGAYSVFKYEGGTHRVQRVPETESQGRIHTSTATVAVLPEAEEVEVKIDQNDLQIDVYRSSGPGGQSVNTTDSAVRITHKPTGIVVSMQDEKSQLQNKERAMRVLRARIYERELAEQQAKIASERKAQVGSGERSEKVRTYNFPQGRVTDHRIKHTSHNLEGVLGGELAEFTEALAAEEKRQRLETATVG